MTTLVTGAFGCIGAWVVRGLLASGERPVVFDLGDDPWRVRMIAGFDAPSRVVTVRGDITDRESLGDVVRDHGIRRVIHLAAWQVPLCRQDPPRGAAINVVGTANVFEVARASAGQIERVVYASARRASTRPGRSPTMHPRTRPRTMASTRSPTRRRHGSTGRSTGSRRPAFVR